MHKKVQHPPLRSAPMCTSRSYRQATSSGCSFAALHLERLRRSALPHSCTVSRDAQERPGDTWEMGVLVTLDGCVSYQGAVSLGDFEQPAG